MYSLHYESQFTDPGYYYSENHTSALSPLPRSYSRASDGKSDPYFHPSSGGAPSPSPSLSDDTHMPGPHDFTYGHPFDSISNPFSQSLPSLYDHHVQHAQPHHRGIEMADDPGSPYGPALLPASTFHEPDVFPAYQYPQRSHALPPFDAHQHIPSSPGMKRESPDSLGNQLHHVEQHHLHQNPSDLKVDMWLREQDFLTGLSPDAPVHLRSLQDARELYERPPYTMNQLAAVAIASHPRRSASSADIRKLLIDRFPYFRANAKELGETLKHALSSYYLFKRVDRSSDEPGRGGLWELDVITNPGGRRTRKRGLEDEPSESFNAMGVQRSRPRPETSRRSTQDRPLADYFKSSPRDLANPYPSSSPPPGSPSSSEYSSSSNDGSPAMSGTSSTYSLGINHGPPQISLGPSLTRASTKPSHSASGGAPSTRRSTRLQSASQRSR